MKHPFCKFPLSAFSVVQLGAHRFLLAVVFSLNLSATAADFTDANWLSMGGIPGADGPVYAAAADGAGNLYIGGSFTIAGAAFANGVAKWDGSNWTALGPGINGVAYALAVSGSDVYVAGSFTMAGDSVATNIAKWNGSSWTALGSGLGDESSIVYALAVQGSELFAGGYFTAAGGTAARYIAKWDGSNWTTLVYRFIETGTYP